MSNSAQAFNKILCVFRTWLLCIAYDYLAITVNELFEMYMKGACVSEY